MLVGAVRLTISLLLLLSQPIQSLVIAIPMSKLPLPTTTLERLASTANSYASANGLQIEKKRDDSSYFEAAPMSLLPNAYPKSAFDEAVSLAPAYNLLVDRVSRDAAFLKATLGGGVAAADPYTAKLMQLYQSVYIDEATKSAAALSADRFNIHRSDYMLHNGRIQQIELNTIAASFASLACQTARLHNLLVERFPEAAVADFLAENAKAVLGDATPADTPGVPENPSLDRLPAAMKTAVDHYRSRFQPSLPLVVLFVVQGGESNTVDQRMLEFRLWTAHQVPVVRLSLAELYERAQVNEKGAVTLRLGDDVAHEVALVYYRAGYAPTDYPDGDHGVEWQARGRLERSRATKAPSLGYHLAGTKKVQQELARAGVLEGFFPSEPELATAMRASFAGLYSLGEDTGEQDLAAVQEVLDGAQSRYVLKPQREGGGYNFYGDKLAAKLKENVQVTKDGLVLDRKLSEYILMERLFPPQQKAILLRSGRIEGVGDSVSELGCYGTILASPDGEILHNEYGGFLLRTKFSDVDEGGVASGFATLSSPYLC